MKKKNSIHNLEPGMLYLEPREFLWTSIAIACGEPNTTAIVQALFHTIANV